MKKGWSWVLVVLAAGAAIYLGWLAVGGANPTKRGPSPKAGTPSDAKAQIAAAGQSAAEPVGSPVSGVVVDAVGKPVVGARVTLLAIQSEWPSLQLKELESVTTGVSGGFTFRAPRQELRMVQVDAAGYAKTTLRASPIDPRLRLQLQPGYRVSGVILLPDGGPAAGCQVFLEPGTAGRTQAIERKADARGRFVFEAVPAAAMRLTARHDDYQPATRTAVTGGRSDALTLQFNEPSLFLNGQVTTATDHKPIKGARIRVYPKTLNGRLYIPHQKVTGADGRFDLLGLGVGSYEVEVEHPEYSVTSRLVTVRDSRSDVNFELQRRCQVLGRLEGAADCVGKELILADAAGQIGSARIRPDGRFDFETFSFSIGRARLILPTGQQVFKKSGGRYLGVGLNDPGLVRLALSLQPSISREGQVVGPQLVGGTVARAVAGARVFAELSHREWGLAHNSFLASVADAAGKFRIAGFPPGEVRLRIRHPEHAEARARLSVGRGAGQDKPVFQLHVPGLIAGRVTRTGMALPGALVFVGRGLEILARDITDADGRYLLRGLPPGDYWVKGRFSTLPLSQREVAVVSGETASADLSFMAGRRIRGTLVDQEDEPLRNSEIFGPGGAVTRTDAKGQFELEVPEGKAVLRIRPAGEVITDKRVVRAEQDTVRFRWQRNRRVSLRAKIIGIPAGTPLTEMLVQLRLRHRRPASLFTAGFEAVRIAAILKQGADIRWMEAPAGKLVIDNVEEGKYSITIWCAGYEPFHVADKSLYAQGDGVAELDLGELKLRRGARLAGRVVDEQGRSVGHAKVVLGPVSLLHVTDSHLQTYTDAEGRFEIVGVGASRRSRVVSIGAAGFGPLHAAIKVPADLLAREARTFVLRPGAALRVVVVNRAKERQPYRGVNIARADRAGEGQIMRRGRTDENGEARFEDMAPGLYQVWLQLDSLRGRPVNIRPPAAGKKVAEVVLRTSQ